MTDSTFVFSGLHSPSPLLLLYLVVTSFLDYLVSFQSLLELTNFENVRRFSFGQSRYGRF